MAPCVAPSKTALLVFAAIHGFDGLDPSAVDRLFTWPPHRDLRTMKVGYIATDRGVNERPELGVLRDLGVRLVPIKLPTKYPLDAMRLILDIEASAVFDELTRKGITEGLDIWAQIFRQGQFVPAVEYLRANRIRSLLARDGRRDGPGRSLRRRQRSTAHQLDGHPTVVLPNGFRKVDEVELPNAISFTGRLYGETDLLAVAHAYQQANGHHLKRPPIDPK